ncbi:MAG: MCP four helix bundle domain-containing protein [Proteobacteria bacterium]|nr:MCP four helix bundle domain-containing protein [Pseudomonadota bacterium]
MHWRDSIRFQLTFIFLCMLFLVVLVGSFSIWRLSGFNELSADVSEVWLPSTRVIGDLNNFTSDFRAIEGSYLLATSSSEIDPILKEMEGLDRSISEAETRFEAIRHDPKEAELYADFKRQWIRYREVVGRQMALVERGDTGTAVVNYKNSSRISYDAASDTLGALTDQIVSSAQAAKDRLAHAYRNAFWLICGAISIAGLLVAVALVYIRYSVSKPLAQLTDCMLRLAANDVDVEIGNISQRTEISKIARAAVVFQNNAVDLMRSKALLADQASKLEEQLAYEQRLTLSQRNFVSMASHEFRTPLTIIDGHARRMEKMKDRISGEELIDRLSKIRSAVRRMSYVTQNLLESARLAEASPTFEPGEFDIISLLHDVCQIHREVSPYTPIKESFAVSHVNIIGDERLLHQVFSNIISNSVKYSPDGSAVCVAAKELNDHVQIIVADEGIGIPEPDQERLFERYHRGSNVSGIVGTGVGLYLVKMVVDRHGGRIVVESGVGIGTKVIVDLPKVLGADLPAAV